MVQPMIKVIKDHTEIPSIKAFEKNQKFIVSQTYESYQRIQIRKISSGLLLFSCIEDMMGQVYEND